MFDINFNIKIIDFGFAAPIIGKTGTGYLKTYLGTYTYMSPEQHLGREYKGEKTDVFALGIILFLIYCNHLPFNAAISKDPFYFLLARKSYDIFWQKHSENKLNKDNFFTNEFKDLFEKMTLLDPEKRISVLEIKSHPWYTKECTLKQQDVVQIFEKRFQDLNSLI